MKYFVIALFTFYVSLSFSQTPVLKEFRDKAHYPFLLHLPETSSSDEKLPVLIFLHGRSLSGNDLNMVKRYGVLDALKRGKNIPAIVVAPQVKKSESWNPDKVLEILDYVQSNYDTDTTRVYVVGMSLGGYGTLHFAGKYPHRVAAAIAMCGGGNVKDACNLGQTNVWIQHGKKDRAVPYTQSLEIFNAISTCTPKGECILTLHPKYGHGELAHEFYKDELYNWLFQFRLGQVSNSTQEKSPVLEVVGMENSSDAEVKEAATAKVSSTETKTTTHTTSVHVVRKGDTLSSIARKHGTSVQRLCKLNGLKESSVLQIGQKIKVK